MRSGSALLYLFLSTVTCCAQQTVFNVPSADVLDKGKIYAELDASYQHSSSIGNFLPRLVAGAGRGFELGVNLPTLTTANDSTVAISPVVKWRFFNKGGWSAYGGDHLFLPVADRTYTVGNYAYLAFAHQFTRGLRISAGGYHFSPSVVSAKQRAGGQFSVEQPLNKRLTFAADWFTGNHSSGYFTPGLVFKATPRLTLYPAYEIGNRGVRSGNHLFLLEVGFNFN